MSEPGLDDFRSVWASVLDAYKKGGIVSERGLQAALYEELRHRMPDSKVIREPGWEIDGGRQVPDIAIVARGRITHVFELKCVLHHYPGYRSDLSKLRHYAARGGRSFDALMEPDTGKWAEGLSLAHGCALHFVAIGRWDAAAVDPASIKGHFERNGWPTNPFFLWVGAMGSGREPRFEVWRLNPGP